MPRREPYRPTHRADAQAKSAPETEPARRGLRRTLVLTGLAVTATGLAVAAGVAAPSRAPGETATAASLSSGNGETAARGAGSAAQLGVDLGDRIEAVSRAARRSPVDDAKVRALSQKSGGQVARTQDLSSQDPRDLARGLLPRFGFDQGQFACLDALYVGESNWNVRADNPSSSAYGIPQALPGSRMASAGADWENNPLTQIRWGLGYIKARYGTPCGALDFKNGNGWY